MSLWQEDQNAHRLTRKHRVIWAKITRHVIRLVVALVVVLVVPVSLLVAEDAADLGMGSTLIGKITTETKDLVAGATVIAYQLSTGNFARSDPTPDTGRFEMTGLEGLALLPLGLPLPPPSSNAPPTLPATAQPTIFFLLFSISCAIPLADMSEPGKSHGP
jgi:hypothetical protein